MARDRLHSDVCYITTGLWEAFLLAIEQTPMPAESKFSIEFPRQTIQINMGCTFHYNVRKPKRIPQDPKTLDLNKNRLLPLLIDEWPTLKPAAQEFWRQEFKRQGIIQDPVRKRRKAQKPRIQKRKHKTPAEFMELCMTFVTDGLRWLVRRNGGSS